eukprot:maker-scaffold_38-snap-gene-1.20-mRNA-1 protein AED:0.00 eAED:0.00 QI:36/1/1/1/1/1/3/123/287
MKQENENEEAQLFGGLSSIKVTPDMIIAIPTEDPLIFEADGLKINWPVAFGGQLVCNAISALSQTVDDDKPIHSFHGYFVQGGNFEKVILHTENIRSGRSFETRTCTASQDQKVIIACIASFKKEENSIFQGYDFRNHLPQEFIPKLANPIGLGKKQHSWGNFERLLLCSNQRNDLFLQRFTYKIKKNEWRANCSILGFMSDFYIAYTLTKNYPERGQEDWLVPSLDHSIHFHRPTEIFVNDWMYALITLQVVDSGRALFTSRMFNLDEALLVTINQEMMVRVRNKL